MKLQEQIKRLLSIIKQLYSPKKLKNSIKEANDNSPYTFKKIFLKSIRNILYLFHRLIILSAYLIVIYFILIFTVYITISTNKSNINDFIVRIVQNIKSLDFENLEIATDGLAFEIKIDNLRLETVDGTEVTWSSADLSALIFESIVSLYPVLNNITISNLQIELRNSSNTQSSTDDYNPNEGYRIDDFAPTINRVWQVRDNINTINLNNATISLSDYLNARLNISFNKEPNNITIDIALNEEFTETSGKVNIELHDTRTASELDGFIDIELISKNINQYEENNLDINSYILIQDGRISSMDGNISVQDIDLPDNPIDSIDMDFVFDHVSYDLSLDLLTKVKTNNIYDTQGDSQNNSTYLSTAIVKSSNRTSDPEFYDLVSHLDGELIDQIYTAYKINVDSLNLEHINYVLNIFPITGIVLDNSTAGYLNDSEINIFLTRSNQLVDFELNSKLEAVDLNPVISFGIPGLYSVTGTLYLNTTSGNIIIDNSPNFNLWLSDIYSNRMYFDNMQGNFSWNVAQNGNFTLNTNTINLTTEDEIIKTNLDINVIPDNNAYVGLGIDVENLPVNQIYKYLPDEEISSELYNWLTNTLSGGSITSATINLDINSNPQQGFHHKYDINAEDILFTMDGLPDIRNIDGAKIGIDNEFVTVNATSGEIDDGIILSNVSTVVELSSEGMVNLSLSLEGNWEDIINKFQQESITKDIFDRLARIPIKGAVSGYINMSFPLNNPDEIKNIEVVIDLEGMTLFIDKDDIIGTTISDDIYGKVSFDLENGFKIHTISGAINGNFFFSSPEDNENTTSIQLVLPMKWIFQELLYFDESENLPVEGESLYEIDISLDKLDEINYVKINLTSNLLGSGIYLNTITKYPQDIIQTNINLEITLSEDQIIDIHGNGYIGNLNFNVLFDGEWQVNINYIEDIFNQNAQINAQINAAPYIDNDLNASEGSLQINIAKENLALDDIIRDLNWLEFNKINSLNSMLFFEEGGNNNDNDINNNDIFDNIAIYTNITNFDFSPIQNDTSPLSVNLLYSELAWNLYVSSNFLSGTVSTNPEFKWDNGLLAFNSEIETLSLNFLNDSFNRESPIDLSGFVGPINQTILSTSRYDSIWNFILPGKIEINNFILNDQTLTDLTIDVLPSTDISSQEEIEAWVVNLYPNEPLNNSLVNLVWDKRNNITKLSISTIQSEEYSTFSFNFLKVNEGTTNLNITWDNSPFDLTANKINGDLSLDWNSAVIYTDSRAIRYFRLLDIIGLLNTSKVINVLQLNRDDTEGNSIPILSATAKTQIKDGVLTFVEPLQAESISFAFEISGDVNIVTEELDQFLNIRLDVAQSIPAIALLFAIPTTGLGAISLLAGAASLVLGNAVGEVSQVIYHITGNFDQAQYELVDSQ